MRAHQKKIEQAILSCIEQRQDRHCMMIQRDQREVFVTLKGKFERTGVVAYTIIACYPDNTKRDTIHLMSWESEDKFIGDPVDQVMEDLNFALTKWSLAKWNDDHPTAQIKRGDQNSFLKSISSHLKG